MAWSCPPGTFSPVTEEKNGKNVSLVVMWAPEEGFWLAWRYVLGIGDLVRRGFFQNNLVD